MSKTFSLAVGETKNSFRVLGFKVNFMKIDVKVSQKIIQIEKNALLFCLQ